MSNNEEKQTRTRVAIATKGANISLETGPVYRLTESDDVNDLLLRNIFSYIDYQRNLINKDMILEVVFIKSNPNTVIKLEDVLELSYNNIEIHGNGITFAIDSDSLFAKPKRNWSEISLLRFTGNHVIIDNINIIYYHDNFPFKPMGITNSGDVFVMRDCNIDYIRKVE